MTATEPQTAAPSKPSRYQFSLRTLLLLFVVLASSMAVFGAWGIVVFALAVGLAIYLRQVESWPSRTELAVIVLFLMCLLALLLPATQVARESARRTQCMNNLRQIALALLHYETVNGCLPPAYVANKNGKPMHSWRVLILPYMEYDYPYRTYDFTEPWDGPNNKKLLAARPNEYVCPSDSNAHAPGATQTSYVAVVGPNAAWAGEKSRKIGSADFAGVASSTIMVVEVTNSGIAWTEPRDLSLDSLGSPEAESPSLAVSSEHGGRPDNFFFIYDNRSGANVAMADGSVRYLPPGSLSTENLGKMLQVGGYKEADLDSLAASGYGRRLNWPNIAALAVWLLSIGTLLRGAVQGRKTLRDDDA